MAVLTRFDPPANINDFDASETALAQRFREEWSKRVQSSFAVGKVGDPWGSERDSPRARFFSPLGVDLSATITPNPLFWTAFPKRILDGFQATHSRDDILKFADEGPPFDPQRPQDAYDPPGARGWQDEYCEWAVERNAQGKITKVTFTCENPEYWDTLWFFSPAKVRDLYRKYLGDNTIQVADLSLKDPGTGADVIDPDTGRPAYDRTNKWNRNKVDGGKNGVMHLISGPNNLFAEIYLASAATILRRKSDHEVTDRDELIDCGGYGSPGRNSDPAIGFYVNDLVRASNIEASLANPVGLYIAGISTTEFVLPANAPSGVTAQDFWKIERGSADAVLRAHYAVPPGLGFVVGDIRIENEAIKWGAQLAEKIQIKLTGLGRAAGGQLPTSLGCVDVKANPLPKAIVFFVNGQAKKKFARGDSVQGIGLFCTDSPAGATVEVGGGGVGVVVTNRQVDGRQVFLTVNLQVSQTASLGFRDVAIKAGTGPASPANPSVMEIIDPGVAGPAAIAMAGALSATSAQPTATAGGVLPLPPKLRTGRGSA
jgi:hypothetical protein